MPKKSSDSGARRPKAKSKLRVEQNELLARLPKLTRDRLQAIAEHLDLGEMETIRVAVSALYDDLIGEYGDDG